MTTTLELARLAVADRQRDAERGRLAALARRVAACCAPASLRARLVAAVRAAGDVCCPSDEERLARTTRAIWG